MKLFTEIRVIKIIMYFNTIAVDFTLNALFYTNDYIVKRYKELEGYEFLISLSKSIFSFLIASVIGFIYDSLTSSKKKKINSPYYNIKNNNINNSNTSIK